MCFSRPTEQRIFDKRLSAEPGDFALKPAIPDPLKMPYPELTGASAEPYPAPPLRFEPPYLDFGPVHIGDEAVRRVTVFNLDRDETLTVMGLTCSNRHVNEQTVFIAPSVWNKKNVDPY